MISKRWRIRLQQLFEAYKQVDLQQDKKELQSHEWYEYQHQKMIILGEMRNILVMNTKVTT